MRILHVIHSVDPRSGGPSHALRSLVRQQADRGACVSVLATTTQSAEPWEPREAYQERIVAASEFAGVEVFLGLAYGRRRPWSRYAYSPQCAAWLARRLANPLQRPSLVHIHGLFSHVTTAAAAAARRWAIPYIVRPAGCLDADCLRRGRRLWKDAFCRWFVHRDLASAACLQATSPVEAEHLRRRCPERPVRVVPHGVEVPDLAPGEAEKFLNAYPALRGRRIVLCMGRLDPIKRFPLAVAAAARARAWEGNLAMVIAGHDAGDLGSIRAEAARHGMTDRIVYPGFLQGAMKRSALAAADLFVLPSAHENFGVAVLEAMAHGLPAVVTPDVAAHVYIDRCGGGRTVEAGVQALADAMRDILAGNPTSLGACARDYVAEHLSWPAAADSLEALYREIQANQQRSDAT